jgi:hypothetical protein
MPRWTRYLIRNCAAILPPALATMVFVLAHFLFSLANDCPGVGSIASVPETVKSMTVGNPLFCKPAAIIEAAFQTEWRRPDTVARLGPFSSQIPPDAERTGTIISYQSGIIKEAKAHLVWLASFVSKVIVCVAAIVGLAWIIVVQLEDFCFDQNWAYQGWSVLGLGALLASSFLCTVVAFFVTQVGLQLTMLPGLTLFIPTATGFYGPDDTVLTYVHSTLLPASSHLIEFSEKLNALAVLMLSVAVTLTLFQHPTQAQRRVTMERDEPYEAFLTRCFQRLTVCIYLGALVLVVYVVELAARFAWPGALISPPPGAQSADLNQLYKDLADAFNQLSSQIEVGYGLAFSLILAALFFPAWTILRRRAWQLVRTIPNLASPADQDKWLADHKMSFTTYQQFGQFLAILAPAGLGSLGAGLKLFGAG